MNFAEILPEEEWRKKQELHKQSISQLIEDYFEERAVHKKHPVIDFLFEYYSFRRVHLETWIPRVNVALAGNIEEFARFPEFSFRDGYAF